MPANFTARRWSASFLSRRWLLSVVPAVALVLMGSATGLATTSGQLDAALLSGGVSVASATTSGALNAADLAGGTASGAGIVSASLLASPLEGGAATGTGEASGAINAAGALIGTATGFATTNGALNPAPLNAGTATGEATTLGSLTAAVLGGGTATGGASTAGSLLAPSLSGGTATGAATTTGAIDAAGGTGDALNREDGSPLLREDGESFIRESGSGALALDGGTATGSATTSGEITPANLSAGAATGAGTTSGLLLAPPFRLGTSTGAGTTSGAIDPVFRVDFGAIGTGATGTNTATPAYPSGISASTSDLFCLVTGRHNTGAIENTLPAGWTSVGSLEGGTGTWGVDTGTRRVEIWRKDSVLGSESGTISVAWNSGNSTSNTLYASIVRVERPSGTTVGASFASGSDASNDTSYSAVSSGSISFAPNDLVLTLTAQNLDTGTATSRALTASGITFGTLTNRADVASVSGNDHRHIINSAPVSAGTATVAATYAYTVSAAASGPTAFLRLRAS